MAFAYRYIWLIHNRVTHEVTSAVIGHTWHTSHAIAHAEAQSFLPTVGDDFYTNLCIESKADEDKFAAKVVQFPTPNPTEIVYFTRLSAAGRMPQRMSSMAAGFDIFCALQDTLQPGKRQLIKTDIAVSLPEGTYGRIAPRSSLSIMGIDVAAGVIDSCYRGAIYVLLVNNGALPFDVKKGDRVAQLIVERISIPIMVEVDQLNETDRGSGGFGSTGF